MFEDLERFVAAHRAWGELTSDVGEMIESGYSLQLACSCGAAFEWWITPEIARLGGSFLSSFTHRAG
jgi:hypothetical protein